MPIPSRKEATGVLASIQRWHPTQTDAIHMARQDLAAAAVLAAIETIPISGLRADQINELKLMLDEYTESADDARIRDSRMFAAV